MTGLILLLRIILEQGVDIIETKILFVTKDLASIDKNDAPGGTPLL